MSWLCPEPGDRLRLVDMSLRVRGARRVQGAVMGGVGLACAPWVGWWLAPLVIVVAGMLVLLERAMPASRRPELYSVGAIGLFTLVIAAAVLGSGGARSPFAGWFLVPLMMLAARFRPRVVLVGLAATLITAGAVFLAAGAEKTLPLGCVVAVWLALVIGVLAGVMALQQAELSSRGKAMVDPLTGLFNRAALVGRFGQAAEQAGVLIGWLSVVMLDIDHFQAVNDTYGHDVGDAVLRGIAEQMRVSLGISEGVYRYGGEEFLLLLPGYPAERARATADQLRIAIAEEPFDGISVTVSAGVASGQGAGLIFDDLLRAADQALYLAKVSGRDQICVAA